MARADAPRTLPFQLGLVLESPLRAPSAFCGRSAAPGGTSRLLRAGFGYEEGVPALPISRERGGSFTGGARGKAGLFATFTEAGRPPAAQQLLQRLKTNISVALLKLGERAAAASSTSPLDLLCSLVGIGRPGLGEELDFARVTRFRATSAFRVPVFRV